MKISQALLAALFIASLAACNHPGDAVQGQWTDPSKIVSVTFGPDYMESMGVRREVRYTREGDRLIVAPKGEPEQMVMKIVDKNTLNLDGGFLGAVSLKRVICVACNSRHPLDGRWATTQGNTGELQFNGDEITLSAAGRPARHTTFTFTRSRNHVEVKGKDEDADLSVDLVDDDTIALTKGNETLVTLKRQ